MREKFAFQVNVENHNETGEVVAVYLRIRKGRVSVTKEHADGALFADYDRTGKLLGIEMIGPCNAKVLDTIAKTAVAKRFVRNSVPRGMLVGAAG